jgi:hypothetical protein
MRDLEVSDTTKTDALDLPCDTPKPQPASSFIAFDANSGASIEARGVTIRAVQAASLRAGSFGAET